MTVCEYIARCLRERGVDHFFGFQGGAVTPLIDALARQGLRYIQNLHEQASGFAADAYSRLSGKIAVVVVTNGPGVTNAVSAIANAFFDSTPCLFISGQVNVADMKASASIRQAGFQEVDAVSLTKTITKYAFTVRDPKSIPHEFEKAMFIAMDGRKGSVLLDVPLDVLMGEVAEPFSSFEAPCSAGDDIHQAVERVVALLKESRRPVCVVGGGVRWAGAVKELQAFVRIAGVPVVSTLMGLDVFSETALGFAGLYGRTSANLALFHSDLVLVLGSRLAKRQLGKSVSMYAPHAKFVQVDIDEEEVSRVVSADVGVCADVRLFLGEMNACVGRLEIDEWREKVGEFGKRYVSNAHVNPGALDPVEWVENVSRRIPSDAVITADVGQNQMWVAQGWQLKDGQRILMSGGLGCMGFSLPAAIGAAYAEPAKRVVAFMGDGGLQMNLQELQTVAHGRLPIKIFVFNNESLGMIQEMQYKYFGRRYEGTKTNYSVPRLEQLASLFGLPYRCVCTASDTDSLSSVLEADGPCLVEVRLAQNPTRVLIRYDEIQLYQTKARVGE